MAETQGGAPIDQVRQSEARITNRLRVVCWVAIVALLATLIGDCLVTGRVRFVWLILIALVGLAASEIRHGRAQRALGDRRQR